jgi:hypothetical protein
MPSPDPPTAATAAAAAASLTQLSPALDAECDLDAWQLRESSAVDLLAALSMVE